MQISQRVSSYLAEIHKDEGRYVGAEEWLARYKGHREAVGHNGTFGGTEEEKRELISTLDSMINAFERQIKQSKKS